jgi:hypothetical protein
MGQTMEVEEINHTYRQIVVLRAPVALIFAPHNT